MRDYAKVAPQFWIDHNGHVWPVIQSHRRLKFKYPLHAAHRAFVFHRDGYKCTRCDAYAVCVPENYDGKETLQTNTLISSGYKDFLVVDHILTLNAGGLNVIENFQTLCETCNKKKIKEDNVNSKIHRDRGFKNG